MVVSQFKFLGPEGTAATQANTGASVATQLTAGATAVFAAAVKGPGSGFGIKVTAPPAATGISYLRFAHTVQSQAMSTNIWLQRPLTNPSTSVTLGRVRNTTGTALSLNFNTVGSLVATDAGGVNYTIATAAQLTSAGVASGGMFKWLPCVVCGTTTTNGAFSAKVYTPAGVQIGSTVTSSACNTGTTGLLTGADGGLTNSATPAAFSGGFADVQFADYAGTSIPPELLTDMSSNTLPTANAGTDMTVEPFVVVTLNGVGVDTDGTIASYAWTQTAGPAVTILNPTSPNASFVATAVQGGTTMTFQLVVTDDKGATSTDTVDVNILSPNFYVAGASSWNPVNVQTLSDTASAGFGSSAFGNSPFGN